MRDHDESDLGVVRQHFGQRRGERDRSHPVGEEDGRLAWVRRAIALWRGRTAASVSKAALCTEFGCDPLSTAVYMELCHVSLVLHAYVIES
jgi:hypothetical protein